MPSLHEMTLQMILTVVVLMHQVVVSLFIVFKKIENPSKIESKMLPSTKNGHL